MCKRTLIIMLQNDGIDLVEMLQWSALQFGLLPEDMIWHTISYHALHEVEMKLEIKLQLGRVVSNGVRNHVSETHCLFKLLR